jgi:glyoxylase-like metal-dependent hydrolase (beta-lactamase superfamily II)
MHIHHLNCGTLCPLGGHLVDGRGGGPLRAARLVCHCLLIETDDGLVLVDTGLGRKDADDAHARLSRVMPAVLRPRLRIAETADEQIRALGFAPSDVRHIVLTHLDFDHAGGIEDFPHARVHVYAEELNAAMHRGTWLSRQRYRPQQWNRAVQWKTYVAHGEPWYGFRCVRELEGLPPEILMVPLVGHTYGHCGVAVRDGQGWLLMAGDAYFFRDEIPQGEHARQDPRCTPGLRLLQRVMEADRRARLLNQRRLRELASAHGEEVRILSAHDAVEFEQARDAATRAYAVPSYPQAPQVQRH